MLNSPTIILLPFIQIYYRVTCLIGLYHRPSHTLYKFVLTKECTFFHCLATWTTHTHKYRGCCCSGPWRPIAAVSAQLSHLSRSLPHPTHSLVLPLAQCVLRPRCQNSNNSGRSSLHTFVRKCLHSSLASFARPSFICRQDAGRELQQCVCVGTLSVCVCCLCICMCVCVRCVMLFSWPTSVQGNTRSCAYLYELTHTHTHRHMCWLHFVRLWLIVHSHLHAHQCRQPRLPWQCCHLGFPQFRNWIPLCDRQQWGTQIGCTVHYTVLHCPLLSNRVCTGRGPLSTRCACHLLLSFASLSHSASTSANMKSKTAFK